LNESQVATLDKAFKGWTY